MQTTAEPENIGERFHPELSDTVRDRVGHRHSASEAAHVDDSSLFLLDERKKGQGQIDHSIEVSLVRRSEVVCCQPLEPPSFPADGRIVHQSPQSYEQQPRRTIIETQLRQVGIAHYESIDSWPTYM